MGWQVRQWLLSKILLSQLWLFQGQEFLTLLLRVGWQEIWGSKMGRVARMVGRQEGWDANKGVGWVLAAPHGLNWIVL